MSAAWPPCWWQLAPQLLVLRTEQSGRCCICPGREAAALRGAGHPVLPPAPARGLSLRTQPPESGNAAPPDSLERQSTDRKKREGREIKRVGHRKRKEKRGKGRRQEVLRGCSYPGKSKATREGEFNLGHLTPKWTAFAGSTLVFNHCSPHCSWDKDSQAQLKENLQCGPEVSLPRFTAAAGLVQGQGSPRMAVSPQDYQQSLLHGSVLPYFKFPALAS